MRTKSSANRSFSAFSSLEVSDHTYCLAQVRRAYSLLRLGREQEAEKTYQAFEQIKAAYPGEDLSELEDAASDYLILKNRLSETERVEYIRDS